MFPRRKFDVGKVKSQYDPGAIFARLGIHEFGCQVFYRASQVHHEKIHPPVKAEMGAEASEQVSGVVDCADVELLQGPTTNVEPTMAKLIDLQPPQAQIRIQTKGDDLDMWVHCDELFAAKPHDTSTKAVIPKQPKQATPLEGFDYDSLQNRFLAEMGAILGLLC